MPRTHSHTLYRFHSGLFFPPSRAGWSAREALLLLIHVVRKSFIASAYPPSCRWGLLAVVHHLPAWNAGAALAFAHPCRRRDRPPQMAYGTAFAIVYPCCIRDCLLMLALHVNVYAPSTPPLWSIAKLSQPPLQRRPSVVTLAAHSSTYCFFL